jgi:RNA polymerase sigma factor (sigma-70 family)
VKIPLKKNAPSFSKKQLYEALGAADEAAIVFLADKVSTDVRQAGRRGGLAEEDIEELLQDVIMITITSIRKGSFEFMDFHPAAYALGEARKMIANLHRKKKLQTETLDQPMESESDFTPEKYIRDKERQQLLEQLLNQLDANCRELIQMKFFDQIKDKEIIEKNLTTYNNLASLRSKRSQCLKRLTAIAREAGYERMF